jgi:hypothetical protein
MALVPVSISLKMQALVVFTVSLLQLLQVCSDASL